MNSFTDCIYTTEYRCPARYLIIDDATNTVTYSSNETDKENALEHLCRVIDIATFTYTHPNEEVEPIQMYTYLD